MTKQKWRNRIKQACIKANTYEDFFDDPIETLAMILEQRDKRMEQYIESGGDPVILHTNKAGRTNPQKNPMLVIWQDLSGQALTYWRDLGLTPKGYRTLTGENVSGKEENDNPLLDILKSIK